MKVLVIGSGGREHALCWKLRQSPRVRSLYCAPGNPGVAKYAEIVKIAVDDIQELLAFAKEERIDLTVVGPEYPLSLGIADRFLADGQRIFGPAKSAARLESSKAFTKEILMARKVPTAAYAVVDSEQAAREYIEREGTPYVLKADGLAAGKGVFVCHSKGDALSAAARLFAEFKGDRVVMEKFLSGREASFIVLTDGKRVVPLATSHDYKRIGDNNTGPNTGGMGTVSPTPVLSAAQKRWVLSNIIDPVLREMRLRGCPFAGFLYAGLMVSADGAINVVEINARCGDPETQVIMRRMDSDLFELLYALSDPGSSASIPEVKWRPESALCVVLASRGYPESASKGDLISGLELAQAIPQCEVFHAGTALDSAGRLVTAGGRVLNVTALGGNLNDARQKAYRASDLIQFPGLQKRRDIGADCV